MKKKIAIGMSGGVDSSVSALLLKEAGFEVEGFFMKFWADPFCKSKGVADCCSEEAVASAEKVAKMLGIPFHAIDAGKPFKDIVVDEFIEEYGNLRTPNPCVGCNKFIKFGWFLEFARNAGFDHVATGHYVKVEKDEAGIFHLLSGNDKTKDQSYFLHRLDQEQLSRAFFPVGGMTKKEVREIAKKNGMDFESKKESQEVCFIRDKNYKDFLARYLKSEYFSSGSAVDGDGKIVGKHSGLIGYTIGQRKGIEYSGMKNDSRDPLYVAGFDKENNDLIVGTEKDIYSKNMLVGNVSWISESAKMAAFESRGLKVKIRYRHTAAACSIGSDPSDGSKIRVVFGVSQKAVTPGQYAVFYAGSEVLGGGTIEE